MWSNDIFVKGKPTSMRGGSLARLFPVRAVTERLDRFTSSPRGTSPELTILGEKNFVI